MLWFHGSMLCNWSFWLYIGETGSKINCLLWWGNTRKTRHQRLFWSQRVSVGKEWKIVFDAVPHKHTRTHTHCIYLVGTRVFEGALCNTFPREISEAARWGVSISDPGAHLEVFSREWGQIHNESPWGLPFRAQFEPPVINIAGGKRDGGWNCVHVRSKTRNTKILRQSDALWDLCATTTPCSVPLDTIFHLVVSVVILRDTFRHFGALTQCHPNLWMQRLKHFSPAVSQSAYNH